MLMGYSTQTLSILDTKSPPSLIRAESQRYIRSKVVVNHQKLCVVFFCRSEDSFADCIIAGALCVPFSLRQRPETYSKQVRQRKGF